jgi:nitroreductase
MHQGTSAPPVAALPAGVLTACLRAAAAAPSIYNSQPWRFRVWAGAVEVLPDRRCALGVVDPQGREMLLSIGAAVMNIRIAMLAYGHRPMVQLLPEREPGVMARVTPGPPIEPRPAAQTLLRCVDERHTNRGPFAATAIPAGVMAELVAAAAGEGVLLRVLDATHRNILFALARTAEEIIKTRSEYVRELAAWTTSDHSRHDGVPADTFGPYDARGVLPLRDFGLALPRLPRAEACFEPYPTIAVLYTGSDTRRQWLKAGQGLQRVLLTATARGLAAQPMTAVLEIPQLRELVSDISADRHAQVVLRLGYGAPGRPAPRRPLADLLLTEPGVCA